MGNNDSFSKIAELAKNPDRARMLNSLRGGRALTATELARVAEITPEIASNHLTLMVATGLLGVMKHCRRCYYRLASPMVVQMVESVMPDAEKWDPARISVGPRDKTMRAGRTYYDHLAGGLGIALTDALVAAGYVEFAEDAGLVTNMGFEVGNLFG